MSNSTKADAVSWGQQKKSVADLNGTHRLTSSTGTLKAASSLWRVAAARLLLQLLMKRKGGGLEDGEGYLADMEHATWVAYLVHGRDSSVVASRQWVPAENLPPAGMMAEPPAAKGASRPAHIPATHLCGANAIALGPWEGRCGRMLQNAFKLS
ncbi:MAG: hypothetical protein FRX49_01708 [Trebouxia sp. A1-2]|nr:MAG: hypothetical protein FRX49_01708 [Trebouxia sp. A1-2]